MVLWSGWDWVVSRSETSQSSGFYFRDDEVGPKPKSSQMYEKNDYMKYQ